MMMLCDTTPRMGEMTGLMPSYAGSECEIGESGIGLREMEMEASSERKGEGRRKKGEGRRDNGEGRKGKRGKGK